MAEPSPIQGAPKASPENVVTLKGKLERIDSNGEFHYSELVLPRFDEYDTQSRNVVVKARRRLGNVGDVITVACSIGGWTRRFQKRDGTTGYDNHVVLTVLD